MRLATSLPTPPPQLRIKVEAGAAIRVRHFHAACEAVAAARPGKFETNLLAGFSAALAASAPRVQLLMIKAKPHKTCVSARARVCVCACVSGEGALWLSRVVFGLFPFCPFSF